MARPRRKQPQLVLDAVHEKGLNASIVYPSGIAGPNDFGYSFFATFVIDAGDGQNAPQAFRAVSTRWTCATWPME